MASKDFSSSSAVKRAILPQVTGDGATVTGDAIDTKGWRWVEFQLSLGTNAATSNGTFKITGADTSGGSYTDITGATTVVAPTDDNGIKRIAIHLDQMPRFMKAVYINGGGGTSPSAAVAILTGCSDTSQYLDNGSGGADEIDATVLFEA